MNLLEVVKVKINEIKRDREYQFKIQELREIHSEFTKDKLELVDESGRKNYFAWVEGKEEDSYVFDYLYILKSFRQIEKEITIDNYDKIVYPDDFYDKYSYDDIEYIFTRDCYNEFQISSETFVIKTKTDKITMRKAKPYFTSPSTPKYCKNVFYDPMFTNEYERWKKEFLPEQYIEVRFDSANMASFPDRRTFCNAIGYEGKVYWVWKENDSIVIMPKIPHIGVAKGMFDFEKFDVATINKIKYENVVCFMSLGDIETIQTISGGEITGGGSDIGKAITGALFFGAVGAIVNSREQIKGTPIKTDFSKVDKRIVRLITNKQFYDFLPNDAKVFKNDDCIKTTALDAFLSILPEKDYRILSVKKSENKQDDNIDKIEKLSKLKEKGIITDEEFNKKKEELLNKI